MKKTPLFNDLFNFSYEEDDFGYSLEWKCEIEKWLASCKDVDEKIFEKQRNRINRAKQRDELLGEYKAMYLVKEMWNMQNVVYTDEERATSKTVDFEFDDKAGITWSAEVKSPSWRAELAEDFQSGIITKDEFLDRKKKPQFIHGEGRWLGFDIFRRPIEDALKKFQPAGNNLLFLCPNTFGPHALFGAMENWNKLRNIVSELDKENKLSAICFFTVELFDDGFKYSDNLINIKCVPVII